MTEKTGGKRKLSPKLYVQVEESLNLRSPKIKNGLCYLKLRPDKADRFGQKLCRIEEP